MHNYSLNVYLGNSYVSLNTNSGIFA